MQVRLTLRPLTEIDASVGELAVSSKLEATQAHDLSLLAGSLKEGLGLPPQAFSYLTSHGSLDLEHMKFFEQLVNRIDNDADRTAVLHTAKVIYRLYADMFRSLPGSVEEEVRHAAVG